ncbi:MAG: hypothetical protein H6673_09880 [Anaerolineales bacterium]|nr:hypothetical protein [Anaerolineales bacterium]
MFAHGGVLVFREPQASAHRRLAGRLPRATTELDPIVWFGFISGTKKITQPVYFRWGQASGPDDLSELERSGREPRWATPLAGNRVGGATGVVGLRSGPTVGRLPSGGVCAWVPEMPCITGFSLPRAATLPDGDRK